MESKGRLSVLSANSGHSGCWLPPLRCLWNAVVLTTGCCLHAWGKGPAMVWAIPGRLAPCWGNSRSLEFASAQVSRFAKLGPGACSLCDCE